MDLNLTQEEQRFKDEVRTFLAEKLPQRLATKVKMGQRLSKSDHEQWHAILNEQGWLAPLWPTEYGGPGWNAVQKFIFENECDLANAPRVISFGLKMLGPVLIQYGSKAQKDYWLPRILNGADWWCQGYSEPGAGSDLASLKTSAVREGDHYVVNGQKTWTTLGQHANMIFCLVRTDPDVKKQAGISFLLIDMNSPGVEVRPITTLDGEHEVNEIFFTNVRVPAANRVGEENKGWTYAKYLLTFERTNLARVGYSMAILGRVKEIARRIHQNGRPLIDEPLFAARLARLEIALENLRITNLRVVATVAGGGAPGAESSILKIAGTQVLQEITALMRRAMGPYAQPFISEALDEDYSGDLPGPVEAAAAASQYFNNRKLSIFGGSNEIQRSVVAKSILGL
jgi:alkylation response protein AidB-like acyl-CoA dehydrogenase